MFWGTRPQVPSTESGGGVYSPPTRTTFWITVRMAGKFEGGGRGKRLSGDPRFTSGASRGGGGRQATRGRQAPRWWGVRLPGGGGRQAARCGSHRGQRETGTDVLRNKHLSKSDLRRVDIHRCEVHNRIDLSEKCLQNVDTLNICHCSRFIPADRMVHKIGVFTLVTRGRLFDVGVKI